MIRILSSIPPILQLSFFYSAVNVIAALAPFALMVVLTRYLSPEEYGIWLLFVSLASFMRPVLGLTFQDAVRMQFFDLTKKRLAECVVTATWISTVIACAFLPLALFFERELETLTKFPGEWSWAILIVAYLNGLYCTVQALLQFRDERRRFAVVQTLLTASTILIVSLLVVSGMSWQGPILGTITGLFLTIAVAIKILDRDLDFDPILGFNKDVARSLLGFGARYLPMGLSVVIVPLTDRLFVAHMVDVAETSYIGIGQMFAFTLSLFSKGFLLAWQPKLFEAVAQKSSIGLSRAMARTALFYALLPIVALGLLAVSLVSANFIVGEGFEQATEYIFWLFVAMLIDGFFQHNQAYLHSFKQISLMSIWAVIVILSNALLNFVLISEHGGIGAAWATGAAYFFGAVGSSVSALIVVRLVRKESS